MCKKIKNLEIGFLIGVFPVITSFPIIELALVLMGEESESETERVESPVTLPYLY